MANEIERGAALALLDEMDAWRRKHKNDAQQDYDYAVRVVCAMVAKAAGYGSRTEWCDQLKANPATRYAAYMGGIEQ